MLRSFLERISVTRRYTGDVTVRLRRHRSEIRDMTGYITTWRKLLEKSLSAQKESWSDIEALIFHETHSVREPHPIISTKAEAELEFDKKFYQGTSMDNVFTAWTKRRVYFQIRWDYGEAVDSRPRNPE